MGHKHATGATRRCRDTVSDTMSVLYLCMNLTRLHALHQGRKT